MKKAVSGLRAWMVQRFTAVYLLLFFVCAPLRFMLSRPHSYEDWQRWMAAPAMLFASALFFVALLLHAWVGLRDVMMDYVRPLPLRLALLAALALLLVGLGLWAMQTLLLATRP